MNVIKFPGRRKDPWRTPADEAESDEGTYSSGYGAETPYQDELESEFTRHRVEPPGPTLAPSAPKNATGQPKRKLSPAEVIARSILPASPFDNTARPPPKSPAQVIAESVRPAAFDSTQDFLRQSFWQVWLQHREYLRKKSLHLLDSHREDAEDALSNTMLKAFHHFVDSAGGVDNMRAWLTTILYNSCMDGHRTTKRHKDIFTETEVGELENLAPDGGSRAQTPEDIVRVQESLDDLYRLILELPEALRAPLLMRTVEHLSYADIAQQLELTEANVRKRVQQARDQLRASRLRDSLAELFGLNSPHL